MKEHPPKKLELKPVPDVTVEVLPEVEREPEEIWVDFYYQGKRSLGSGCYVINPKPTG